MAKGNNQFLNPEKNAPGCGAFILVLGIIILLFSFGNPFEAGYEKGINVMSLIEGLVLAMTGFGLFKRKKLGIYGLGALLLWSLLVMIYNLSQGFSLGESFSLTLIIYGLLLWWFYRVKDSFK